MFRKLLDLGMRILIYNNCIYKLHKGEAYGILHTIGLINKDD